MWLARMPRDVLDAGGAVTGGFLGPLPPSYFADSPEGGDYRSDLVARRYVVADAIVRGDRSAATRKAFAGLENDIRDVDDLVRRRWAADLSGGPPRPEGPLPFYVDDLLKLHPEYGEAYRRWAGDRGAAPCSWAAARL